MRSRLVRESVRRLLEGEDRVSVVGCSGPGEVRVEQIVISGCDVMIVDFLDLGWLERFRKVSQRLGKRVKIVAIGTGKTGLPEGAEAYVSAHDSKHRIVAEARGGPRLTFVA